MKKILLASTSPRRRELLSFLQVPFIVRAPFFDEEAVAQNPDPVIYGHTLSEGKARSLEKEYSDHLIIAADTLVQQNGRYFAKPQNRKEAKEFLVSFSGKSHEVITSVTLLYEGRLRQGAAKTVVYFATLLEEEIETFLDRGIWTDKAGGYAIQGIGSLLVDRIEGCFYNVVGLPIRVTQKLLLEEGVDLWQLSS